MILYINIQYEQIRIFLNIIQNLQKSVNNLITNIHKYKIIIKTNIWDKTLKHKYLKATSRQNKYKIIKLEIKDYKRSNLNLNSYKMLFKEFYQTMTKYLTRKIKYVSKCISKNQKKINDQPNLNKSPIHMQKSRKSQIPTLMFSNDVVKSLKFIK